ncbi:MAG: putative Se/S carrier-like protein [Candidatus Ornithomonoglobus sp.]
MLAVVGSITTATRLARLIEKNIKSPVSVVHTPSNINKGGCSYSVRFKEQYEQRIRGLVSDYNFQIKGFYYEDGRRVNNAVP